MIQITVEFRMEKNIVSMPEGSTADDLMKRYPFKSLYMTLNGTMVLDDPKNHVLKDGDYVRLSRYLVAGG